MPRPASALSRVPRRAVCVVASVLLASIVLTTSRAHAAPQVGDPVGAVDVVELGTAEPGWTLRGWAADPDAPNDPGLLHVYVNGRFFEEGRVTGIARPDVPAAHPWASPHSGWTLTVPFSDAQVCVYAINVGAGSNNTTLGCVRTPTGAPVGWLDVVAPGYNTVARIQGWARDPDTLDPIKVRFYLDGNVVRSGDTGLDRPDVGGHYGFDHIFYTTFPPASGTHTVCVAAIDPVSQQETQLQGGCKQVTVTTEPFGRLDGAVREGNMVHAWGWMIDPLAAVTQVGITGTTGAVVPSAATNLVRPDVDAAHPGYAFPSSFRSHGTGFDVRLPVPSGPTEICAYGRPFTLAPTPSFPGCTIV